MTKAVFLHIGLFKSGTTYLQHVLWESRDALADDGILVPGRDSAGPAFAALDAMRIPASRRPPASYGAWGRFAGWVNDWEGDAAVVSAERLTFAGPRAIRRMLADLAPASVHVMVTVRDLARVVPSSWQERVRNRKTVSWPDFLAAVVDPNSDEESAKDFWRKQDAPGLLARWAEHVPAENISVITVPASGSDPQLLPARFAEAIGSDVSRWKTHMGTTNDALGVTETEMLRRLNPRLPQRITTPDYNRYVKLGLARNVLGVRDARRQVRIPAEQAQWLEHQAQRIIDGLRQREYRIVGDLDDLMPSAPTGPPPEALTVSDDDMLDASLDVIAHLVTRLADQLGESQPATEFADPRELRVTDGYADWLERHASRTLDDLRTLGYRVVGDAEQQVLSAMAAKQPDDATVPTGELLDTSLDINAYLVTRLADTRP